MLGYIVYYIEHLSERAIACISMPQTHYFKLFSFWLKTLGPWAWRANHTFDLDRHLMKLHYRGCKIPKYHRLSGWVEWVAQLFNQINQYFQPSAFTLKSFAWRENVQNGLSQFGSLLGLCLQLCLVCETQSKSKLKKKTMKTFHWSTEIHSRASDRVQDQEQRRHEVQSRAKGLARHPLIYRVNLCFTEMHWN